MGKITHGPYSLGIIIVLIISTSLPVFAEVTSLQTNAKSYEIGDKIEFSGTVKEDSTGLVTIVIRDFDDQFVLLLQAIINPDYTFSKSVTLGNEFSKYGLYNYTGFILNMSKGITDNFEISSNDILIDSTEDKIQGKETKKIRSNKKPENKTENTLADFVDPDKKPQHYIDRYYNEPLYKSWFDRNYPETTIEKAVGYEGTSNKITSTVQKTLENKFIPEADASPIVKPSMNQSDSETGQIILAIIGLGILFGAVYGVKRKVDDNSKQISINKETIKKRIILPMIRDSPKNILQTRLAKGEITIEEYEKLRSKLS